MESHTNTSGRYKNLPTWAGLIVIFNGLLGIIGWLFDIPRLQNIVPSLPKMPFNTAFTLVLAGLSLLIISRFTHSAAVPSRPRRVALMLAVLVLLFGLLTLGQYLFGWNLGIDQLLFKDQAGTIQSAIPGRSAPHTTITFILTSLALILFYSDNPDRHRVAQFLTLAATFIPLLALIGYIYSVTIFFSISAYTGMAIRTAFSFIVLCIGLLFLRPSKGLMGVLTTRLFIGGLTRRLWVAVIILPLIIGWLTILGEEAGLYSSELEPIFLAISSAYALATVIWWYAHALNRMAVERTQADEQFRLVVEASPNAFILVDTAGRISLMNKQAESLFGYARKDLLGQPVELLVPHRFRTPHDNYRANFLNSPTARPMGAGRDLFGLRKDGSEVPVEIGLNPITTAEGNFVLASIIDITERKQTEEQFRLTVEASPNAIILVGMDGNISLVNTQTEVLFGYRREELLNQPIEILVPIPLRTNHQAFRDTFFKEPSTRPMGAGRDLFGLRKDGRQVPIEIGLNPITLTENDFVMASIIDITERKQAELEIADLLQREQAARIEATRLNLELEQRVIERTAQLEATNKELEAFAYSVSHDLRAPLRSIDGFSQALLEDYQDSLDSEAQEYLKRVRAGSQRMAQLIDELLMLSQFTRSEMHRTTVDLSGLVKTIADELRQGEPERQVTVLITADVTAQADKQLMRAVLENLVGNAWKFTSKRTDARIEFGVTPQPDGQPAYFVRDNGAGFNMAYTDKMFGAFQRLHTAAEFPGTGIGLATVQRIIHRHGGRIWAEGAVDQGATFYFTLRPFRDEIEIEFL